MLKKLFIVSVCFLIPLSVYSDITFDKSDFGEFSFYGFVKTDVFYQDGGVNIRSAPMTVVEDDNTDFHISIKMSRFGLKWSGKEFDNGWKLGAHLEFDLFDTSSNNKMHLRERIIVFTLSKGQSSWMFGQHWDIFSPLNATTLNIIGNLFKSGNQGFRRSQVRYTYKTDNTTFAFSINDPTSDYGIESGSPLYEASFNVRLDGSIKSNLGLSIAQGTETRGLSEMDQDLDIMGFNTFWNIQFSNAISFKGEYNTGKNLSLFLSNFSVMIDNSSSQFVEAESDGLWGEFVISLEKINLYTGASYEKVTNTEYLSDGGEEKTNTVFAGVAYKFSKTINFGVEFTKYKTDLLNSDSIDTKQIQFSATYKF